MHTAWKQDHRLGLYKLLIENLVRSRRKWQETWQALTLLMLYVALGSYEWQLCSTLQRFTSCASAVSAIIEQHVLLCKLKKKRERLYPESHILFFIQVMLPLKWTWRPKARPHVKYIRHTRLSATEKADEAMLFFEKNPCTRFLAKTIVGCSR